MSHKYKIVNLTQGTMEWLEWRQRGIGGSDAPIIMGENPWRTAHQLHIEKTAPAIASEQNEAMARGTALEGPALALYCKTVGMTFEPMCVQSIQHEWLRASVDGISVDGTRVVEIKCGPKVYQKTAMSGSPPAYYYGQLQHALAVTDLGAIDFYCYLPNCTPIHLTIERNDAYIKRLLVEEDNFWKRVLAKT